MGHAYEHRLDVSHRILNTNSKACFCSFTSFLTPYLHWSIMQPTWLVVWYVNFIYFQKKVLPFRYGNRKIYFEGSLFLDAHIACYWWRIYHLWRDLRGRKLPPQMSVSEATHMDCLSNMSQLNHHKLTCYNKKINWKTLINI